MHLSDIIRWAVFLACGGLGWWIVILNFAIVYRSVVRREHHSWVPLVGGFLAFFGMMACPLPRVEKVAWVPLAVDCGFCLAMLVIGFSGMLIRSLLRGKKDDA